VLLLTLISFFCISFTLVASEEQTAEEYLDQFLEENSDVLSEEQLQLYSRYREEIIQFIETTWKLQVTNDDLQKISYKGNWVWFGEFPWVYSAKYEVWLYLYPNLDVSIYNENEYIRKDSDYCRKMNWAWVAWSNGNGISNLVSPPKSLLPQPQSNFAYSNEEKAWLHFKQKQGDKIYAYSSKTWRTLGETFKFLDLLHEIKTSAVDTSIALREIEDSVNNPILNISNANDEPILDILKETPDLGVGEKHIYDDKNKLSH